MADPRKSMTYKDVCRELESCNTPQLNDILSILDLAIFQPKNRTTVDGLRGMYGPDRHDVPTVLSKANHPWKEFPAIKDVQKMLRKAIKEFGCEVTPPSATPEDEMKAGLALVKNLDNEAFNGPCHIPNIPCPELDDLRKSSSVGWPGTLCESRLVCDVMPAGSIRAFDIDEHHKISFLVSGRRVWFQCPPTQHNIAIFCKLTRNRGAPLQMTPNDYRMFQGGVLFRQKEGETVEIAPFCMTMIVSTATSVSANAVLHTAGKVAARVRNLDVFRMENDQLDGEMKQGDIRTTLLNAEAGLFPHMEKVLAEGIEYFDPAPVRQELADVWDSKKDYLYELLVAVGDKVWTPERIAQMWSESMVAPNKRSPQKCALCIETFNWNNRPREYMLERLSRHFVQTHWPAPTPTKRRKRKSAADALMATAPTPTKRAKRKSGP